MAQTCSYLDSARTLALAVSLVKDTVLDSIEIIPFYEKKPIASIHEFWDRQEVRRTHLGVLQFLDNRDALCSHSPTTRISEGLSVPVDAKPTNAIGQVGLSLLGLHCALGAGELERVDLGTLL